VFNVLLSATEARPAGTQGCWGLVGIRERNGIYCCGVSIAGSTSMSSRPVAMANLIVARTASISPGQMVLSLLSNGVT
jgi:hypothetical protein